MAAHRTMLTSNELQEYKLWPARGKLLLVVLLVLSHCLSSAYSQDDPIYTDVQFVTEPSDVYTTQSLNIARFYCRATGLFVATNTTVLLDTRFLLDDDLLTSKFFPADRHEYLIDGDDDYVVGIMVRPIQPSDNGNVYKCQVMINGMPTPMFSRSALLTVGDGLPPAIPLLQSTVGLYHITVTWSLDITLPTNGLLSGYIATVYDTSDQLVYSTTIEDGSVSQYTFTNLQPSTTYKLSVVGVNSYGEGNVSPTPFQASTQSPIVTGPPLSLSFTVNPGIGNIIVAVTQPPNIDNTTMTPVTQYSLVYTPSGGSSSAPKLMPADNPHFFLYDLTIGESYSFEVSAISSAGSSAAIVMDYVVESYTGSQIVAQSTQLTTSTTTTTIAFTQISPSTPVTTTTATTVPSVVSSDIPSVIATTTVTTSSQTLVLTFTTTPSSLRTTFTRDTTTTTSNAPLGNTELPQLATSSSTVNKQPIVHSSSTSDGLTTAEPSNASSSDIPINAVVLGIGCIAAFIMIAIIIVAVLLVFFCIRSKKDNENFTDFEPSNWPHKPSPHTNKTWSSKESSIKGSPISGSLSEDIELPIEGGRYLQVPSDSPPILKGTRQGYGCAEESKRESTEIKVEINGGMPPSVVTPV